MAYDLRLMTDKLKYNFPKHFFWGTATSSHQIEGNNENNWTVWERKGHIKDGSVSGRACNSYEMYKEDIKLCKELNNNAYRFSIEWSRVEPEKGKFDKEALQHYRQVVAECRKNNIEPFVTLYHWTQPLWFAKLGGWLNRQSPLLFRQYAETVAKHLGREVTFWCTVNEPMVYAYNSYLKGKWPAYAKAPAGKPPLFKRVHDFLRIVNNLIKAHKLSYFTLHDCNSRCKVSIAKNNQFFESYVDSFVNKTAVKLVDYYWNYSFLNKIRSELDYIGLNYYFHNLIYGSLKGHALMNENKQVNDMGWEVYPKGIYEALKGLRKYELPIYILENGLADAKDARRADFIKDHLRYVHRAIQEGINVRGYFHWSLIDNFEWSEGYGPKFGLYKVDLKTFERTARPSAKVYAEIVKHNGF